MFNSCSLDFGGQVPAVKLPDGDITGLSSLPDSFSMNAGRSFPWGKSLVTSHWLV